MTTKEKQENLNQYAVLYTQLYIDSFRLPLNFITYIL